MPTIVRPSSTHLKHKQTVQDFLFQEDGTLLALTLDQPFITLIRLTMLKEIDSTDPQKLIAVNKLDQLHQKLDQITANGSKALVFMEHMLGNQELCYYMQRLKARYQDLRIIMLVMAAEKDRLMLFHELGADNVIVKPVSINTLIEKMATTLQPQSKVAEIINAAKHMLKEDPSRSLTICQKLLETNPTCAAAHLVMGDAYQALDQINLAEAAYLAASKESVLFLEPLERLARLQEKAGNFQEQLEYLTRLEALSPLNPHRKVDVGAAKLSLGQDEEAEKLFATALAQYVRDAKQLVQDIAVKIGNVYLDKNPELAKDYYRKGLEAKGELTLEDIATFNSLGLLLRKQGKWREAILEYRKALSIAPKDENLYYNMGMAYAEGKSMLEASQSLLRAWELNPDILQKSSVIAQNMGIIFMQTQLYTQARRCLQAALKLDPDSEVAKNAWQRLPR